MAQLESAMKGSSYQPVVKVLGNMGGLTEMELPSHAKVSAAFDSASSVTPTQTASTHTLIMTTPPKSLTKTKTLTTPPKINSDTKTITKTRTEPTPQSPTSPESDYESDLEPVTLTTDLDEKRQEAKAKWWCLPLN